MNVAIDLKNLWLYGKGIGAFTTNLLQDLTLVEQQPACSLQLYAPSFDQPALERWPSAERFQCIPTYSFNRRSRSSKLYYDQYGLLSHLRKHQADLLFSPYFDIPFGWKKKLITTVHDLSILEQRQNYGRAFFTYYQQLLKKAIRQSAFIVTVSGYSATKLQEVFNLPEDRIRIIYNKAPEAFQQVGSTNEEQAALRERYKLPGEFILYTGGIEARKNIPLLVEGWRQAGSAAKQIPPLVVTGLNKEQRTDLLRWYPDCQHLLLLDFLPYKEIAMLYRMSGLVVNCSGYEGFGMPVLEALTMGVPMLCSDIPVYKEIGQDLVYYFRNGDQQDFSAQLISFFSGRLPAIDHEKQNRRAAEFNRREYGNLFYEMINQA